MGRIGVVAMVDDLHSALVLMLRHTSRMGKTGASAVVNAPNTAQTQPQEQETLQEISTLISVDTPFTDFDHLLPIWISKFLFFSYLYLFREWKIIN